MADATPLGYLTGNPNYIVQILSTNQDNPERSVNVWASMPETFMYDASSSYEAPFAQGLFGDGMLGSALRVTGIQLVTQTLTAQIWQGSSDTILGLDLEFQAVDDADKDVRQPILQLMSLTTPGTLGTDGLITSPGPSFDPKILELVWQSAEKTYEEGKATIGKLGGFGADANAKIMAAANTSKTSVNGSNVPNNNTTPADNKQFATTSNTKQYIKNPITIKIGKYALFDSVVITNVQKTYQSQLDEVTGLPHYARVSIQFKPLFMIVQNDLQNIFPAPKNQANSANAGLNGSSVSRTDALNGYPNLGGSVAGDNNVEQHSPIDLTNPVPTPLDPLPGVPQVSPISSRAGL